MRILVASILTLAGMAERLDAATAVVPDDYATIQLALDSPADTVLVRDGTYPERLTMRKPTLLAAHPANSAAPAVEALQLLAVLDVWPSATTATVSRIHVTGGVHIETNNVLSASFAFESCRLDSGVTQNSDDIHDVGRLTFDHCEVRGLVDVFGGGRVESSSFTDGGFVIGTDEDQVEVRNSVFQGPGEVGIRISGHRKAVVTGNRVSGFGNGIVTAGEDNVLTGNTVEDCSSGAFGVEGTEVRVADNIVRGCGSGMTVVGTDTIHVLRNRVHDANRWGILVIPEFFDSAYELVVDGNVVGRGGEDGIKLIPAYASFGSLPGRIRVTHNTSYLNQGSGIFIEQDFAALSPSVVTHNVGFRNGRYGLEFIGTNLGEPECNDWYQNSLGATAGIGAGASDLALDPIFCDLDADDVSLRSDSPLLDAEGCGLIGALGEGCSAPAAVDPLSEHGFRLRAIAPNPARGAVRLAFFLPVEADVELAIFDLQGRQLEKLVGGRLPSGAHAAVWNGAAAKHSATPGVYFVRFRHPGGEQTRRVLLQ